MRKQNINSILHHIDPKNTTFQKWSFESLTKEKMKQNLLYWMWQKCAVAFKYKNRNTQYLQLKIIFFLGKKTDSPHRELKLFMVTNTMTFALSFYRAVSLNLLWFLERKKAQILSRRTLE